MVTSAPGAAVRVIGAVAVAFREATTSSLNRPRRRHPVWPGRSAATSLDTVANGWPIVPRAPSLPPGAAALLHNRPAAPGAVSGVPDIAVAEHAPTTAIVAHAASSFRP